MMYLNGFAMGFLIFQLFDQSVFFYPVFGSKWEHAHTSETLSAWLSKRQGLSQEHYKWGVLIWLQALLTPSSSLVQHTRAPTPLCSPVDKSAYVSRVSGRSLPWGFLHSLSWWRIHLQCRRRWFDSWVGKTLWRRERLPTPVFWPGEFHGLCSLWGCKESDTTERLSLFILKVIIFSGINPQRALWKEGT